MSNITKKNLDINVEYLTRVEGHGNIVINVKEGKLEKCQLNIIEAPRFFEQMVKGRSMFEVQHITSRICGICSTGHCLASIKATEDAIGFTPSEQTRKLRKLALHYETQDSHLLHILFLVAPDCVGAESVFPMIKTHPEVVVLALKVKKICSDLCDILLGRHTHPITLVVRGFTKLPQFERETEYLALSHPDEYAFLDGNLKSSDGGEVTPQKYLEFVHEYYADHCTSKHSKNKRTSYMVGALARFNINHEKLPKNVRDLADQLGLKAPCYNPYMNTVAQAVETLFCAQDSIRIIDEFLAKGINKDEAVSSWPSKNEAGSFKIKAGRGVG